MTRERVANARITVATAGHLSTCPRMVKAADALHASGYRVRVVSASHTDWATDTDEQVARTRQWAWTRVDCSRITAPRVHAASGVRARLASAITRGVGAARTPVGLAIRAYSRIHDELAAAIAADPTDLIYAGTTGALAAAAEAADRLGVPFGLDLEDFHSGEHAGGSGVLGNALAERIEPRLLATAAFLTAGSPMIAAAYREKYGVAARPIHNTFSIDFGKSSMPAGRLRLYWFSQTIGPGRGLEEVMRAVGAAGFAAELHLRGRLIPEYGETLRALQNREASSLRLVFHAPVAPDAIVAAAHGYHLGLSCEEPAVLNRRLCLGNKIFVYLAAGVPVLLSGTPAQTALAADLGAAALTYESGNVGSLAALLATFAADAGWRASARAAAARAAIRRWHWEHPEDRGALLAAVASALGAGTPIAASAR
jgi:hypothetical protein